MEQPERVPSQVQVIVNVGIDKDLASDVEVFVKALSENGGEAAKELLKKLLERKS